MIYRVLGLILVTLSLLHILPAAQKLESRLIRSLQTLFNRKALIFIFREIRSKSGKW